MKRNYLYEIKGMFKGILLLLFFRLKLLNEFWIPFFHYDCLLFLKKYLLNEKEYSSLVERIYAINQARIIKKCKQHQKIKVAFLNPCASNWGADDIYKLLEKNKKFFSYVVIPGLKEDDSRIYTDMHKFAITFFQNKHYHSYIPELTQKAKWKRKLLPDIVIHNNPYYNVMYQEQFNMGHYRLNTVNMLIPYSFWIDRHCNDIFSVPYISLYWKIFCPSQIHKVIGIQKNPYFKKHFVYSGYPKIDQYYKEYPAINLNKVWKIDKAAEKLKIIYAPGMLAGENIISTFNLNYNLILNIAKKFPDQTVWIIRPHPALGESAVSKNVFKNIQEYKKYLSCWSNLPNASVSLDGSYHEIFMTSDCMIMDSISFLPIYQYLNKPLLLLTKSSQRFNSLGERIKEGVYTAYAKDEEKIIHFIQEVGLNKNDFKMILREDIFKKYLDYKTENNKLASEYIYEEIIKLLT